MKLYDNGYGISYARPEFSHGTEIMIWKWGYRSPRGLIEKFENWLHMIGIGPKQVYKWADHVSFSELPKPLPVKPHNYDSDEDPSLWAYLKPEEKKALLDWVVSLPSRLLGENRHERR